MKNKGVKAALIAAGGIVVLAGVTAAIWASAGQPDSNMSSYVAKTPVEPISQVEETKPQPTGQYAVGNQPNAVPGDEESEEILTLEGMTDDQIESFLAQAAADNPYDAEVNTLYWKVFKIMRAYYPGRFKIDHMWDEFKDDVVEATIDLYNSGELTNDEKETVAWFVYDQISGLDSSSPYYAAGKQIVEELQNQPGYVRRDIPAS